MYFVAGIVLAGYLALGVASYRRTALSEELPKDGERLLMPFYRMAACVLSGLGIDALEKIGGGGVRKRLEQWRPKGDIEVAARRYYVRKLGLVMAVLFVGTVLACLVKFQSANGTLLLEGKRITRGSFDQGNKKLVLKASLGKYTGGAGSAEGLVRDEGGDGLPESFSVFEVEVHGQIPAREQADALEKEFWEQLAKAALGQNRSPNAVSKEMNLVDGLEGYPFLVEWNSDRPDLVDSYGWVRVLEQGEEEQVCLKAKVRYEGWSWEHQLEITLVPPEKTEAQKQYEALGELLAYSEETSRGEMIWDLPVEWEGREIHWEEEREDYSLVLWSIALAAAVAVFFLMDKDLDARITEKEQKLKEAYPSVVNKLELYLGAGLNVRGAFFKIAENYTRDLANGKGTNPAYEELLYTCHELQAGISESCAYERLGQRSGLQEYVRFGAILNQNLTKGSGRLLERLSEEADRSRQEQINRLRQRGEMASTKLLVPMVMMLGIIMIMIMLPAFGGF